MSGFIFLYPKGKTLLKLLYCSFGQVNIEFDPIIIIDNSCDIVFIVALRNYKKTSL